MPQIFLDGNPVSANEGATIADLVPDKPEDVCFAVIRPSTIQQTETRQFLCKTTAGEIVIETHGGDTVLSRGDLADGLSLGWQDLQVNSVGPFPSSVSPIRRPSRYSRGDVAIGCAGYDPSRSYLIFVKKTHSADHGSGEGGTVIGTVVSGLGIMDRFTTGDRILSIEPVISFAESSDAYTTTDTSTILQEGMHIITHLQIVAQGYDPDQISPDAAVSVEYMLLALRNGRFEVDHRMSNHIRSDILAPTDIPMEVETPRREGAVLMRTSGKKRGSLYIYTRDLPRSMAHTTVGQVVHGIELAKIAKKKDRLDVRVIPQKLDLIGRSVSEAAIIASEAGVTLEMEQGAGDSIIISQDPPTTMEALSGRKLTANIVPSHNVVDISLDEDHAPVTTRIFREASGLKFRDIGIIRMLFSFDDVFLFSTRIPKTTNINPENVPLREVPANSIAMTNDSRKGVGTVGIRTVSNTEFGPTSEPFSGTNILGSVHNPEILSHFKDNDLVYFREVRR